MSIFLSSFASVKNRYNRTQPVISTLHTKEQDIRPIGKRSRKHERIMKLSANSYALIGGYYEDGIGYNGWSKSHYAKNPLPPLDPEEVALTAPIVWHRKRDNTEYVTINNAWHGYANALYEFFRRHLPRGMHLPYDRNGRQRLRVLTPDGHKNFFLPKNKFISNAEAGKSNETRDERGAANDRKLWRGLRFKRVGDCTWELVSEEHRMPTTTAYHVLKDEKAKYKTEIAEFKAWALSILPVLQPRDHQSAQEQLRSALEYHAGQPTRHVYRWTTSEAYKVVRRAALCDPASPLRLELVYRLLDKSRSYDYSARVSRYNPEQAAANFNNFVNKVFNFLTRNDGDNQ